MTFKRCAHDPDDNNDAEMQERFDTIERLAATDVLTGLANRRGCEKSVAAEITRAERQRTPLSVILLDINQLNDVNETYGYVAGDRVLREISAILRRTIRPSDMLSRWGADEFLIVLSDTTLEQAQRVAVRVRGAVRMHAIEGIRPVTVASGVSEIDSDFDFAATLRAAYRRLNQAKRSGEADADPSSGVREPRTHGPQDKRSAATVDEP